MRRILIFLFLFSIIPISCFKKREEVVIVIEDKTGEGGSTYAYTDTLNQRGHKENSHVKRISVKKFVNRFDRYIKGNKKVQFLKDLGRLEEAVSLKLEEERGRERRKKLERILHYIGIVEREVERSGIMRANGRLLRYLSLLKEEIESL